MPPGPCSASSIMPPITCRRQKAPRRLSGGQGLAGQQRRQCAGRAATLAGEACRESLEEIILVEVDEPLVDRPEGIHEAIGDAEDDGEYQGGPFRLEASTDLRDAPRGEAQRARAGLGAGGRGLKAEGAEGWAGVEDGGSPGPRGRGGGASQRCQRRKGHK